MVAAIVVVALVGVTIASRTHHSSRRTTRRRPTTSRTNIDLNDQPTRDDAALPVPRRRPGADRRPERATARRHRHRPRQSTPNVSGLPLGPVTIVAHSGTHRRRARRRAALLVHAARTPVAHRVDADTAFPSAHAGRLWLASHASRPRCPATPIASLVPASPRRVRRSARRRAGLLVVDEGRSARCSPPPARAAPRLLVGSAGHRDRRASPTASRG